MVKCSYSRGRGRRRSTSSSSIISSSSSSSGAPISRPYSRSPSRPYRRHPSRSRYRISRGYRSRGSPIRDDRHRFASPRSRRKPYAERRRHPPGRRRSRSSSREIKKKKVEPKKKTWQGFPYPKADPKTNAFLYLHPKDLNEQRVLSFALPYQPPKVHVYDDKDRFINSIQCFNELCQEWRTNCKEILLADTKYIACEMELSNIESQLAPLLFLDQKTNTE